MFSRSSGQYLYYTGGTILKRIGYLLTIMLIFSCAACTKEKETADTKSAAKKSPGSVTIDKNMIAQTPFHGEIKDGPPPDPAKPIIAALKQAKLSFDDKRTIGEVFDSYRHASKKEWHGTISNNSAFIDFICRVDVNPLASVNLKEEIAVRVLDVKFAIHEGRDAYVTMVSRTDQKRDGSLSTVHYESADRQKIIKAIYAGQEIPF